nr:MAG TPA: hypothetical protein [Caudoviricetes sp.]
MHLNIRYKIQVNLTFKCSVSNSIDIIYKIFYKIFLK